MQLWQQPWDTLLNYSDIENIIIASLRQTKTLPLSLQNKNDRKTKITIPFEMHTLCTYIYPSPSKLSIEYLIKFLWNKLKVSFILAPVLEKRPTINMRNRTVQLNGSNELEEVNGRRKNAINIYLIQTNLYAGRFFALNLFDTHSCGWKVSRLLFRLNYSVYILTACLLLPFVWSNEHIIMIFDIKKKNLFILRMRTIRMGE